MRINKYLSSVGHCSRRKADDLVKDGRVKVNGIIAVLGDRIPEGAEVKVDDILVKTAGKKVYLAYHKQIGIICTTDENAPDNIIDAVKYPERVYPIGRLDVASSGLILLTNDGSIVNKILKAQNHCEKEYEVRVREKLTSDFLNKMKNGIYLDDKKTMPAKVIKVTDHTFRITLVQGLNRQIRRMCDTLNYEVVKLRRIRVKNIHLGDLQMRKWRELTQEEVEGLKE